MSQNKINPLFFHHSKVPNFAENINRAMYFYPDQPIAWEGELFAPANPRITKNIMPNRYLVSNYGRVWDTYMNQFTPATVDELGYTRVTVTCYTNDDKLIWTKASVHRMVMGAFCYFPGCEELEVNHLDTNKYNGALCNYLDKLEWCTRKENMQYAASLGHMSHPGEDAPSAKFTNDQVREMCRMFENGSRTVEVAEKFNAKYGTVQSIKSGQNFSIVSKDYNMPETRKNISRDMIIKICDEINNGKTNVQIAAELGVTTDIVSNIRCGNTWTDITEDRIEYSQYYKTNSEIHRICKMLEDGYSLTQIMKATGAAKGTIIGIKKGRIHTDISREYDIPVYTQVNTSEEVVREICERLQMGETQASIGKDLVARGLITNKNVVNDISRRKKFKSISKDYKF